MHPVQHPLVKLFIGCAAYFGFAQLGLLFAIPPGFASAIWPAAGIALGLYLMLGRWVVPGIFLGSLFANLQVSFSSASFDGQLLIIPSLIALASCLQLYVAKSLLLKFLTPPIALHSGHFIFRFFTIIGPMACLTASSIAAIGISLINQFDLSQGLFLWFTWWIGDILGVLFFTPIVLLLFNSPLLSAVSKRFRIILPAITLFALMSSVFIYSRSSYLNERQNQFNESTAGFSDQIGIFENTVNQYLYAIAAHIGLNKNLSQEQFKQFVYSIQNQNINIRAIAWAPKIKASERKAYEQFLRQRGLEKHQIRTIDRNQKVTIAPRQDYYLPVTYSEPFQKNVDAIGLDLKSHPFIATSISKAIHNRQVVLTPKIHLVQSLEKLNGMIAYYPVFDPIEANQLLGLVEIVFETDQVFDAIYKASENDFNYQTVYFVDDKESIAFQNNTHKDDAQFNYSISFDFFDKHYRTYFQSSSRFDAQSTDWFSWIVLILGSLLSVLSFIFVVLITSFNSQLALEVKSRTNDLEKANVNLMNANHAKSQFLSNMSHEYRTPLNAIIGFCQIAKDELTDPVALGYFRKIENSSYLLLDIINTVLDYSKINEGRFALNVAPFTIENTIDRLETLFAHRASRKGLDFNIITPSTPTPELSGDRIRFEQILVYLTENALKFTEQGEVQVAFETKTINSQRIQLVITISDQGIGISRDKLNRLFDAFSQEDESDTRPYSGTGLGLSITKKLIDMMGGTISVESVKHHGTEFRVTIPFDIINNSKDHGIENESTPQYLHPSSESNAISFAGKRALVVEDNHVNQIVASKLLEQFGLSVSIADDGQQAIETLNKKPFDIIFMDLQMPIMDGFSAIEAIRKSEHHRTIPVVILSASVTKEQQQRAESLGIKHYITKPYRKSQLYEVLCEYLTENNQ